MKITSSEERQTVKALLRFQERAEILEIVLPCHYWYQRQIEGSVALVDYEFMREDSSLDWFWN